MSEEAQDLGLSLAGVQMWQVEPAQPRGSESKGAGERFAEVETLKSCLDER